MIKKIKYKYLLSLAFLVSFLFLKASFISALEVDYRSLGLPANPTLPQYVSAIFTWAIGVAGVLALISFTIGAIGLINPNPESHNEAKERMKGAVLGLVLTVAAFIIIRTINPTLVSPTISQIPQPNLPPPATSTGVYYYSDNNCSSDEAGPNTVSQDDLSNIFNDPTKSVKSIKIINNPATNIYYGVIPHESFGLDQGGICRDPLIEANSCLPPQGCCENSSTLEVALNSIDVFRVNVMFPLTSGNGVSFYSEPYGKAGVFPILKNQITPPYQFNPANMKFDYTANPQDQAYKASHVTFQDSPNSIIASSDNYLVALYSKTNNPSFPYCQTFGQGTVTNLQVQPIILEGKKIDYIYIIPLKPL